MTTTTQGAAGRPVALPRRATGLGFVGGLGRRHRPRPSPRRHRRPGGISARAARHRGRAGPSVRNIARTLGRPGHALPHLTTNGLPVRTGPGWATHPEALAALRGDWYPEGVAARRDALILVLTAAGFIRRRIATLRPDQIVTVTGITVDQVDLLRDGDPVLCPRCALVRWAQVLDAFADRSRLDVEDLLTRARDHSHPRHDYATPLPDRWRQARWVIPAIDRHGAIEPTTPLTARALTGSSPAGTTPTPYAPPPVPGSRTDTRRR